jgi:hypothetical protein
VKNLFVLGLEYKGFGVITKIMADTQLTAHALNTKDEELLNLLQRRNAIDFKPILYPPNDSRYLLVTWDVTGKRNDDDYDEETWAKTVLYVLHKQKLKQLRF